MVLGGGRVRARSGEARQRHRRVRRHIALIVAVTSILHSQHQCHARNRDIRLPRVSVRARVTADGDADDNASLNSDSTKYDC